MFIMMIFNNCIHHVTVSQLQLYYSIVHTMYIHGTDMSVHVYASARWSGFQMFGSWNAEDRDQGSS